MSDFQPPAPPPPPPPGGGYGAPPPAGPPGGGFGGQPSGGAASYSVGEAFSYAWSKFQANAGQMILAALAIFVGAIVIIGTWAVLSFSVFAADFECSYNDNGVYRCDGSDGLGFFGSLLISAVFFGLFFIFAQVIGAGLIRASLNVTNGLPFRTADVFKFDNLGPVVITSLIVGAGIMVGTVLCYIPGLIVGFLTSYSLYFVVDKNMAPMDAIKASVDFVTKNLGQTILWYLVSMAIILVGELACGVGLLVAIPVVLVGTAYTYKKISGQPIAP